MKESSYPKIPLKWIVFVITLISGIVLSGSAFAQIDDNQTQNGLARIQIIHLAPFNNHGATVDIYVDGRRALSHVDYLDSTSYLYIRAGERLFEIYPSGSNSPAISATVDIEANNFYTAIAVGDGANRPLSLIALEDDLSHPPSGQGKIRLGHLAPFADSQAGTTADVRLQDGTIVLDDVQFGTIDNDFSVVLPEGTYDLKITTPDGATTLIDPAPIDLDDGDILSALRSVMEPTKNWASMRSLLGTMDLRSPWLHTSTPPISHHLPAGRIPPSW